MDNRSDIENPTAAAAYGRVSKEADFRQSLYKAARSGDWKAAEDAYKKLDATSYGVEITKRGDSALHVAAANKRAEFVRNLVQHLNEKDLELVNSDGETALHVSAASGAFEVAKIMLDKNKNLASIQDPRITRTPLEVAAVFKDKRVFEFLFPFTILERLDAEVRFKILMGAIDLDLFDIALNILNENENMVSSPEEKMSALEACAHKPLSSYGKSEAHISKYLLRIMAIVLPFISRTERTHRSKMYKSFHRQLVEKLWKGIQASPDFKELIRTKFIFHDAVKGGNFEFLKLLTNSDDPHLFSIRNHNGHTLLDVAIINRQERMFRFFSRTRLVRYSIIDEKDPQGNNTLHLAGLKPPGRILDSMVPGAALQMQRELLWFQEVKKIVPQRFLEQKNIESATPDDIFIRQHEQLQKDGVQWMKDTASSCMVVATLITTVAFAAAFTVPGGNQDTGIPILLKDMSFTVFVISDAIGMFSSTTSIMMFLSILTSRYTDEDFLYSLPKRLVYGLLSLFASIVCLVLAFTATFFLVYKEEKQSVLPKLVAVLACFPVALYVLLNFKLWIDIVRSAWVHRVMFKPKKQRLFRLRT